MTRREQPVNFVEKLAQFDDHWAPRVIAQMNNYQFKLVKVLGEFVWHDHPDTDEVFIVLEGRLVIRFADGQVELGPGDLYVVPKGVQHQPVAEQLTHVLLVEPEGVVNTGDTGGALTANNDVWI